MSSLCLCSAAFLSKNCYSFSLAGSIWLLWLLLDFVSIPYCFIDLVRCIGTEMFDKFDNCWLIALGLFAYSSALPSLLLVLLWMSLGEKSEA